MKIWFFETLGGGIEQGGGAQALFGADFMLSIKGPHRVNWTFAGIDFGAELPYLGCRSAACRDSSEENTFTL